MNNCWYQSDVYIINPFLLKYFSTENTPMVAGLGKVCFLLCILCVFFLILIIF